MFPKDLELRHYAENTDTSVSVSAVYVQRTYVESA